jgi:hypothetical protein
MSGGQQANFGQGAVNVLGDETEGTMVGSFSTASPGSFGKSVIARLRSKKIIDSATSRTLTGSALSGLQGAFGRSRTKALSGSAVSSSRGNVTPSQITGDFLVEEVATDSLLQGHPDVRWYSNKSTLDALLGGNITGARDMYLTQSQWPTNYGHDNSSMQQESSIFNLWSLRAHSCYYPDHYLNTTTRQYTSDTTKESAPWVQHTKYCRTASYNGVGSSFYTPMGTQPITEMYFRWGIYLESSILAGMVPVPGNPSNTIGFKLGGVRWNGIGNGFSMWCRREQNGEGKWQLQCYASNELNDLADWQGGSPSDYNPSGSTGVWLPGHGRSDGITGFYGGLWYGGVSQVYLFPETWHWLEMHIKLNTNASTADGLREIWLDDNLILQHPNCKVTTYTGSNPWELSHVSNQWFHGGTTDIPSEIMWGRTAGMCVADRRIGKPIS